MEYISSDTNIWLDFANIGHLELPFRLPYTYLMNVDAVHDELLAPPELGCLVCWISYIKGSTLIKRFI